ncbi:hypothetical protein An18g03140 [Aspergillus niger]|uniref:Uncharacterized protein n=2 Tax=Aspergillus niger TaxID=5061 RepID=A2RAH2_ASPNC|nr:hypothetical protein An18g03140 [Aspergillus niger]CAK48698.1 hypothetical protein An18g03140 [Aspergillus niger]
MPITPTTGTDTTPFRSQKIHLDGRKEKQTEMIRNPQLTDSLAVPFPRVLGPNSPVALVVVCLAWLHLRSTSGFSSLNSCTAPRYWCNYTGSTTPSYCVLQQYTYAYLCTSVTSQVTTYAGMGKRSVPSFFSTFSKWDEATSYLPLRGKTH